MNIETTKKIDIKVFMAERKDLTMKAVNEKEEDAIVQQEGESFFEMEPEGILEELLSKLNPLIGLDGVKTEVEQIINLICLQKKGENLEKRIFHYPYIRYFTAILEQVKLQWQDY